MLKQEFIKQYLFPAQKAGECFGINPVVILAQSAIETGWGESTLAKEYNNFFGITAYGRPNAFWKGKKTDLSENGAMFPSGSAPTNRRKTVLWTSPV